MDPSVPRLPSITTDPVQAHALSRLHHSTATALPKAELHAHLNGSIRLSTLESLANAAGLDPTAATLRPNDPRTLPQMFAVFGLAHQLIRGPELLSRVTKEALEDMAADGVVYAEIRTTPRAHEECGMDKAGYINAVLEGFRAYDAATPPVGVPPYRASTSPVTANLILSFDRKDAPAEWRDTLSLALTLSASHPLGSRILGIDVSGDPSQAAWHDLEPILHDARTAGFGVVVHAGEMPDRDAETEAIIRFRPDRIGHACYLSAANRMRLRRSGIPLELCLTSNVLSRSVEGGYEGHHFGEFGAGAGERRMNAVSLGTDDSAVFGSTLSQEYAIAAWAFGMGRGEMAALATMGMGMALCGEDEKRRLREKVATWIGEG